MSLHLTSCGGYIWQPIWVLHLTSHLGHFIWQVVGGISGSLSGYFISHLILITSSDKLWGVYLAAYLGTSSHISSWSLHLISCRGYIWALHLKTWPNSAICFKWALFDNIDQKRTLLLALAVSYKGEVYLRMLSENLNSFQVDSCFDVFSMKDQWKTMPYNRFNWSLHDYWKPCQRSRIPTGLWLWMLCCLHTMQCLILLLGISHINLCLDAWSKWLVITGLGLYQYDSIQSISKSC